MAEKPTMKDMPRFREPTAADDLQPCAGCHVKTLPEYLDKHGLCFESCSEFSDEEDERKAENEKETQPPA